MNKIAAIITAAGLSRRFGSDKLFSVLNGVPVISYIIKSVENSAFSQRILVTNNSSKFEQLEHDNIQIIENNNYLSGMSSSIVCGIKALNEDMEAAMIIPADMPLLSNKILNYIIEEHIKSVLGISGIYSNGKIMSPVLFNSKYFQELLKLQGDRGAKNIVESHINDFNPVSIESNYLMDIDTADDMAKLAELINGK